MKDGVEVRLCLTDIERVAKGTSGGEDDLSCEKVYIVRHSLISETSR